MKACEWKRDNDGGVYVSCGDFRVGALFQPDFDEELGEHLFVFCPYCGGLLTITVTGRNAPAHAEAGAQRRPIA